MLLSSLLLPYAFSVLLLSSPPSVSPHPARWWLFLAPETLSSSQAEALRREVAQSLTPRSLKRRSKVIGHTPPIRLCDLPPSPERLKAIEETGCQLVVVARYVGAVSVKGPLEAIKSASRLPFVLSARPVYHLTGRPEKENEGTNDGHKGGFTQGEDSTEYGYSWYQLRMVNVPAAHRLGFMGRGVLVGVQDSGFDRLSHRAFRGMEVVASWDFLNGDGEVGDEGDRGSGRHGTRTLSLLAGYHPGVFIGVAPHAQYVLTKTEDTEGEYRAEEDFWVAGLWFHDSLGVEVLSSSLSYRDWYEYSDMDGQTALVSRAADSAVAAGMVIVNSMGNRGLSDYPLNKLGAPADARGVIAAGGTRRDSTYWPYSSQGPTADGRIKPDLSTLATTVWTASSLNDSAYSLASGTSFSCPVIAGIAALVLQVAPHLTPYEVSEILRSTASRSDSPDTLIGWGIPDALRAIEAAEERIAGESIQLPSLNLLQAYPNPFNHIVRIAGADEGWGRPVVYDARGVRIYPPMVKDSRGLWSLDFSVYPAGVYFFAWERERQLGTAIVLTK